MAKKSAKGKKGRSKAGSKGDRIKKSKIAESKVSQLQKCVLMKLNKGKLTLSITGNFSNSLSPLESPEDSVLNMYGPDRSAQQLQFISKNFKKTSALDEVKKYLTMQNIMETSFMENARIGKEIQAEASSMFKNSLGLPENTMSKISSTVSDRASLNSFLGLSTADLYTILNPKWTSVFRGSMQEIIQNIENEREEESRENKSDFVTGSTCSLVSHHLLQIQKIFIPTYYFVEVISVI